MPGTLRRPARSATRAWSAPAISEPSGSALIAGRGSGFLPDLGDLPVGVGGQALELPAHLLAEPLDLVVAGGAGDRVAMQDLALGHPGLVHVARLAARRPLRVRERP